MKKMITLLLAFGSLIVNAQTSKEEARRVILGQPKNSPKSSPSQNPRDVILGGGNGDNTSTYPGGSRTAEVDAINREYDAKIQSVRNNPLLSREQKDLRIRQLEEERRRKIREIKGRYENDDHDDDHKYKKGKGNNGKHLGWQKGVGNPHKNGGKHGKGKNED